MSANRKIEGWQFDGSEAFMNRQSDGRSRTVEYDVKDNELWTTADCACDTTAVVVPLEVLRAVLDAAGFDLVKREP